MSKSFEGFSRLLLKSLLNIPHAYCLVVLSSAWLNTVVEYQEQLRWSKATVEATSLTLYFNFRVVNLKVLCSVTVLFIFFFFQSISIIWSHFVNDLLFLSILVSQDPFNCEIISIQLERSNDPDCKSIVSLAFEMGALPCRIVGCIHAPFCPWAMIGNNIYLNAMQKTCS